MNQQLKSLEERVIAENICPSLAANATQLVFGGGNPNAEIVLIGEAPGKKEDESGKPFVGASGRFLDEMLAAAGLKREDIYITNIVKYRPPNNRDPSPKEKREFWPVLVEQLKIIKPQVIVTLGRHSGACFLPDLVISRDHGQPRLIDIEGLNVTLLPLYHPAAALYNGAMRQTLIDDFMGIASQLTNTSTE